MKVDAATRARLRAAGLEDAAQLRTAYVKQELRDVLPPATRGAPLERETRAVLITADLLTSAAVPMAFELVGAARDLKACRPRPWAFAARAAWRASAAELAATAAALLDQVRASSRDPIARPAFAVLERHLQEILSEAVV